MNYFIQIISRRTFARTAFSALHQPKLCEKLPYLPRVYLPNKTVIAQFVSQRLKQQFKLNNAGLFKRQQLNRNNSFCQFYNSENRRFHTSLRRDAWPIATLLVKLAGPLSKISKLGAILLGRSLQKLNPKYKKLLFTDKRTEKIIAAFVIIAVLSVLYYLIHLEEAPFTRRLRFMAIGNAQMDQIIESEYKQALELCGPHVLPVNHPDHIRVYQVTKRLVSYNQCIEMEGIKWNVNVVDTPDSNAFVLPNGQIFMFKGLLDKLNSDSALATILGHEMAHAILNHGAEQASLHGVTNLFIVLSLTILWALIPSDVFAIGVQWIQSQILQILLHLPFSRQLEEEADEVGMLLAAKACFDVRESPKLWRKLAEQERIEGDPDIEWLSTHPSHKDRASHLDSLLPEALQIRRDCNCPALDEFSSTVRDYQPRLLKLLSVK